MDLKPNMLTHFSSLRCCQTCWVFIPFSSMILLPELHVLDSFYLKNVTFSVLTALHGFSASVSSHTVSLLAILSVLVVNTILPFVPSTVMFPFGKFCHKAAVKRFRLKAFSKGAFRLPKGFSANVLRDLKQHGFEFCTDLWSQITLAIHSDIAIQL